MESPKLVSIIKVNDTFVSYQELRKVVEQYEKINKLQFWISDAKRLHRARPSVYEIVKNHPELEYCSLKLSCIYGGKDYKKNKKTIQRRRASHKQGCKAEIFVTLNDCKNRLIITRMEEKHNHDIPFVEPTEYLKSKQQHEKSRLAKQISFHSKLRERELSTNISLDNLVKSNSLSRSKNFKKIAEILTDKYSCTVDLQRDENNKIYGFFFQDEYMKKSFQLFPEILLIDGTFTLQNINSPLYVFSVENSMGETNIVGVAVLTVEDENSIKWMIDRFKHRNSEWKNTNIVLTGHKSCELQIPNEFPEASTLICLTHALYLFKSEVRKKQDFNLLSSDIAQSVDFFKKLANAKSEEEYFTFLEDMEDDMHFLIMEYFYSKWHDFRKLWVAGLNENRNFIGCALEDRKSKFKNTISTCNTFQNFVGNFFTCVYAQRRLFEAETRRKIIQMHIFQDENQDVVSYDKYLTAYAFEKIRNNLQECENNLKKFKFSKENEDIILQTEDNCFLISEISCSCDFFTIMKLPCEHVLAYRRQQKMELFEFLFSDRWTKNYLKKLFEGDFPEIESDIKIEESVSVESVCFDLAELCNKLSGNELKERLDLLLKLKRSWENRDHVVLVSEADSVENMELGDESDCRERIILEIAPE